MGLIPGWGRFPEKEVATILVFLPREYHGQRGLANFDTQLHRVSKSQTRLKQLSMSNIHAY